MVIFVIVTLVFLATVFFYVLLKTFFISIQIFSHSFSCLYMYGINGIYMYSKFKTEFFAVFFFCVCKNCFKTHETGVAKLKTGIINFDSCFCIHNFWKSQNISGDWTIINTHKNFLNYNIYNFHRRSPYLSFLTWNISTWRRFLPAGWCLTGNGLDEGKYPWNNPFITRKPTVRHNIKVEGWCCAKIQK